MGEGRGLAENYCYRHPDRQSFVLCQRCGRTICPQCQTVAAVGVICPECMKEQRANAPRVKRPLFTQSRDTPVVTYALIGITVVIFILQWIPGLDITARLGYAGIYSHALMFEPWRLMSSIFVHSTGLIFHILVNMYTLFIFGWLLEGFLGRIRFLALYLISGLAGSVAVLLLADPYQGVVGASGAIFGLMGAFLVIQRKVGGPTTQLLILLGINFVIGFIPIFNISWQAHLGGLLGGALIGLIFLETQKPQQKVLQISLVSVVALVLMGVGIWPVIA
jgi:membrane associated rhomboid family serine protease